MLALYDRDGGYCPASSSCPKTLGLDSGFSVASRMATREGRRHEVVLDCDPCVT